MADKSKIYEKEANGNPIGLLNCEDEPLTKFQVNGYTNITTIAGGSQLVDFTKMANDEHYNSTNQPTNFTFNDTTKTLSYRQHRKQTIPKFPVKLSDLHDTLYFKCEDGWSSNNYNDEVILYYFRNGSSSFSTKDFDQITSESHLYSLDTSSLPSNIEYAYIGFCDTNWQEYKTRYITKPILTHDVNTEYSDYGSITHNIINGVTGRQTLFINNHEVVLDFGGYEIFSGEYLYKYGNNYYIRKRFKRIDIDINDLTLSNPGLYENITPVAFPKPQDDRAYDNYNKTGCMFTHATPADSPDFDNEEYVGSITASLIKKNYIIAFPHSISLSDAQANLRESILYYKPMGTYDQLIEDPILISQLNFIYTLDLESGEDDHVNTISFSDENATLSIAYYTTVKDQSDDWVDPDTPQPVDPDDPEAPTYTHVRYSPNPSGSNMTINREENSRYVGTVITDSPLAPTNPEVYTWVRIVDEQTYGIFQDDLYEYLKETLSENLTEGDLDIIIRLMCYIFGDLTGLTYKLGDQVDVDLAEEDYLRHLSTLIGYEWNDAFTADQQRESIKLYMDIRKRRGTIWSLENLARVLGQDVTSFYSSSDLRGVNIIEYNPNSFEDVNYFDIDNIEDGKEIDKDTGNTVDSPNYVVSDYIEVYNKHAYYLYYGAALNKYAAFYDKDKNFISSFSQSVDGHLYDEDGTIPVPSEETDPKVMFIRFTIPKAEANKFKITQKSDNLYVDKNGLYPGDIMVEVPQFSTVLREALDDIRLIGTRIVFAYLIYMGPFKLETNVNGGIEANLFFDPAYWGYDPTIKEWGPNSERTLITDIKDWFVSHRVKSAITNASVAIYLGHKDPYTKGFIWNVEGLEDYKGFLVDDETLHDDHKMYE